MHKALREKILGAPDREAVREYVEEWDVELGLRPLSGLWRQSVLDTVAAASSQGDAAVGAAIEKMVPMLIAMSAVDPADGRTRIFDDGDAEWLGNEKSGHVLHRLGARVLEISKLGEADLIEAGNSSSATESSGTGTSSRSPSEAAEQ